MSFSSIPVRSNGQKFLASWFNALRTAGIGAETYTSNTSSTATAIVAGTGIVHNTSYMNEKIYVAGSGGAVDISANPQISVGTSEGKLLTIVGTSDTNTVKLEHGTGIAMNGFIILKQYWSITFSWDSAASLWVEVARSEK